MKFKRTDHVHAVTTSDRSSVLTQGAQLNVPYR